MKLTRELADTLLPMTAHQPEVNPRPDSEFFIRRQLARIARLRQAEGPATEAEILRCEMALVQSRKTLQGRARYNRISREFS